MEITPDVLTVDYTGKPGERTFFLQAKGEPTHTYLCEKQQIALLADKLREMLLIIDGSDTVLHAAPARDPAFDLATPLEPEWRVGPIGLGYAEESDSIVVSLARSEEQPEEEEEEIDESRFEVRYVLRRDQARSFVLHALAVVSEGRDICQLCGLPMDPEGHRCPASNGHRLDA